jgi:hypothetical protein
MTLRSMSALAATLALLAAVSLASAQASPDLTGTATHLGDAPGFENDYVRVHYALYDYLATDRRPPATRPVVLFIAVGPTPGVVTIGPLPPPKARPSWRPGVVARGISIEVLARPPKPPALGVPGTGLPAGSREERAWDGGRLLVTTFRPMDYGVGAGPAPSVTTFLSDGVIEVSNQGLRRRMAVQAGDAFWFEAATRITVVDDYPVGAAVVQLVARR